jgi:hypothetical protein
MSYLASNEAFHQALDTWLDISGSLSGSTAERGNITMAGYLASCRAKNEPAMLLVEIHAKLLYPVLEFPNNSIAIFRNTSYNISCSSIAHMPRIQGLIDRYLPLGFQPSSAML